MQSTCKLKTSIIIRVDILGHHDTSLIIATQKTRTLRDHLPPEPRHARSHPYLDEL